MKDNVLKKCSELFIDCNEYIDEIFGKKLGNIKIKGLMDCYDEQEFDTLYAILRGKWLLRPNGAKFTTYMDTYKKNSIKKSMLASTRTACGLGDPPEDYAQNNNESMNAMIKRSKDHGKLSLKENYKTFAGRSE